ncbi:MAG: molybdate ABC transporter permease subunit [Eggerthellaceae bacterium]|nr:molybdate ABC transporter permease subunit [Eggerthellaceae bacterium]
MHSFDLSHPWIRKVVCMVVLCGGAVSIAAACLSSIAWADDDLGDVTSPRTPAATSSAASSGASSATTSDIDEAASTDSAQSFDTSTVTVSAEDDAAVVTDASFGLEGFNRAQVGSDREINGSYYGYSYYIGGSTGNVVMITSAQGVVVYIPADQAAAVGFDVNDTQACQQLRNCLYALDGNNANGGSVVADDTPWYFTDQQQISIQGVTFSFDREYKDGQYYASVISDAGQDVTIAGSTPHLDLGHACFAQMASADDVALVAQPTPWESLCTFLSHIDYSPLWVTLKTTGTAIIFIFILGLAAAYFSQRISPRARDVADSIFTIPMVLPPTVCGFLLLLLLGRNTGLGRWFIDVGCPLIFSWPATVIAAVVVAFPLMYRSARGAFESLDPHMLDAARTLGWSNRRIFYRLMLPLSWSNIASGTVLAFARALGEFGATLFLAGNYLGITRTIPIAIYFEWMNGNTDVALFWTVIIIIFSFIVILFINIWSRHTTRYRKAGETR